MPTCERFQATILFDPEVAKSFLQELTDLYTWYYTQLSGPDGVFELSKVQCKFNTIRSHTQKKTTKQTNKKPKLFQGKFVSTIVQTPQLKEDLKGPMQSLLILWKRLENYLCLNPEQCIQSGEHSTLTSVHLYLKWSWHWCKMKLFQITT